MCTDGTPASAYLATWSCTIQADTPPPGLAVMRTAAWAKATMHHWGLGGLAEDVNLIVAELSSNAWTHGSPPVKVTLLLHESDLIIEVRDAGAGLAVFAGPRPLGAGGRGLPAAADIAQQIGIDGGAWGTRMWARLHFQWLPAETEPGSAAA
jgi:anti-sigma regulatory factor (Ser/Thr protein kinase)